MLYSLRLNTLRWASLFFLVFTIVSETAFADFNDILKTPARRFRSWHAEWITETPTVMSGVTMVIQPGKEHVIKLFGKNIGVITTKNPHGGKKRIKGKYTINNSTSEGARVAGVIGNSGKFDAVIPPGNLWANSIWTFKPKNDEFEIKPTTVRARRQVSTVSSMTVVQRMRRKGKPAVGKKITLTVFATNRGPGIIRPTTTLLSIQIGDGRRINGLKQIGGTNLTQTCSVNQSNGVVGCLINYLGPPPSESSLRARTNFATASVILTFEVPEDADGETFPFTAVTRSVNSLQISSLRSRPKKLNMVVKQQKEEDPKNDVEPPSTELFRGTYQYGNGTSFRVKSSKTGLKCILVSLSAGTQSLGFKVGENFCRRMSRVGERRYVGQQKLRKPIEWVAWTLDFSRDGSAFIASDGATGRRISD